MSGTHRPNATLADVARVADVSMSTASRVIRNAPSVSEKTRKRVADAVRQTGYHADPLARSLRNSGDLGVVCLVVPDLSDPYFADLYMNLQALALDRGDTLMVGCHLESLAVQQQLVDQMARYRPAAMVLVPVPGTQAPDIQRLQSSGVPVVIVDRPVAGVEADTVLAENERGAEMLIERLLHSDDERVGIVTLPQSIWTQEKRCQAVVDVLARRGITPSIVIEEAAISAPSGDAFSALFEQEVTAVIALSVPPAMGVIRRVMQLGVPALAIGCFDRHPWFDLVNPDIVTVSQDPAEVAQQIDAAISRRRLDGTAIPHTSVVPFRLDEPHSTVSR